MTADYGLHRRAIDLADDCEAFADGCPWGTTRSHLLHAASSLRWQVRWEQKHPSPNDGSAATP